MEWKVPLFDLHFGAEEKRAVIEVLDSKWISSGSKTAEFERRFAALTGAQYAVAVSNGTAALHLAVLGLDIGPGDEVIVPSLTFAATVNSIYYAGARPVFADITSIEDLTIFPQDVARKITDRTKAIMVMHYGGFACAMDEIMEIARQHNLSVIEDAAHAPGATFKGQHLGTIGDVGAFSFFSNKNITTAEGGMVVTNNKKIADQARLLRSHGMTVSSYDRAQGHANRYDIFQVGFNYRLDDIRAALGGVQLDRLGGGLRRRRSLAAIYHQILADLDGITIPFDDKIDISSNYILPVVLNNRCPFNRDEFRELLEAGYGIQTSIHYPAVHKFTPYRALAADLPVTEYVVEHEMTLPLYYSMTEEQVVYVCQAIKDIIAAASMKHTGTEGGALFELKHA